MPRTNNLYGRITITKRAIRHIALQTARESVGIASVGKAKIKTDGNHIIVFIELYLKFGVQIDPTIDMVRKAIRYNIESFTNMTVECVDIDVLGIK